MLKQMLLIGAAAVSFPALAQTTGPAGEEPAPASQSPAAASSVGAVSSDGLTSTPLRQPTPPRPPTNLPRSPSRKPHRTRSNAPKNDLGE